jgi:hypothetical protein
MVKQEVDEREEKKSSYTPEKEGITCIVLRMFFCSSGVIFLKSGPSIAAPSVQMPISLAMLFAVSTLSPVIIRTCAQAVRSQPNTCFLMADCAGAVALAASWRVAHRQDC